ncbi:GNAT family N-acetyltransferase [Joostella sp. CR20]|uniref:GNAT family N-acetyltransferase n=1 Tax=Joostella sp. CR20 TaxID=2804312 RepID=UPI00313B8E83
MKFEIVPFQPQYANIFKDLNVEWLEKHFVVEKHDEDVLANCKENIIDTGGAIYFAKIDKNIVGCFAFYKIGENRFELTKMAVSPNFRGQKIGQQLLQFAINAAKEKQFDELLLYSSRKLENAIYLYRKYGFIEVPLEENSPYKRADIKMVYPLS